MRSKFSINLYNALSRSFKEQTLTVRSTDAIENTLRSALYIILRNYL